MHVYQLKKDTTRHHEHDAHEQKHALTFRSKQRRTSSMLSSDKTLPPWKKIVATRDLYENILKGMDSDSEDDNDSTIVVWKDGVATLERKPDKTTASDEQQRTDSRHVTAVGVNLSALWESVDETTRAVMTKLVDDVVAGEESRLKESHELYFKTVQHPVSTILGTPASDPWLPAIIARLRDRYGFPVLSIRLEEDEENHEALDHVVDPSHAQMNHDEFESIVLSVQEELRDEGVKQLEADLTKKRSKHMGPAHSAALYEPTGEHDATLARFQWVARRQAQLKNCTKQELVNLQRARIAVLESKAAELARRQEAQRRERAYSEDDDDVLMQSLPYKNSPSTERRASVHDIVKSHTDTSRKNSVISDSPKTSEKESSTSRRSSVHDIVLEHQRTREPLPSSPPPV